MSERLDHYLFGGLAAARPYLMLKGLLLLLGLDCLIDLLPHGGRYGIGGFNVAHFAWLDALPTPTPAIYVGMLVAIATLAFVLVFGRLRRSLLVLLTALYTLAWSISLLDAYQHHYLISLLLLSACSFPLDTLREAADAKPEAPAPAPPPARKKGKRAAPTPPSIARPEPRRRIAPAYVSFLVTCAIVYLLAAASKLELDFRDGSALRRIVEPETIDGLLFRFARFGVDEDAAYAWLARGAIAIQVVSGLAFLVVGTADRRPTRARLLLSLLGLAPLVFHLSADELHLEIGWFSRYMIWITLVAFLPHEILRGLLAGLLRLRPATPPAPPEPFTLGVFAVLSLLLGSIAFLRMDLPGAIVAGVGALAAVVLVLLSELVRGGPARVLELPAAIVLSAWLAYAAIAHPRFAIRVGDSWHALEASTVRYDFYRYVGGDARRRGELPQALAAYRKALAHAPDEMSRRATRTKMERIRPISP